MGCVLLDLVTCTRHALQVEFDAPAAVGQLDGQLRRRRRGRGFGSRSDIVDQVPEVYAAAERFDRDNDLGLFRATLAHYAQRR